MYIFLYCHTSHVVKKGHYAGCFIGPPDLHEGENPPFWILLSFDCTVSLHLQEFKQRTVSQYIRTSRCLVSIPQVSITSSTLLWDPYSLGVSRIVAQAISILPIKKYPWTLPLSNLPKFPTPHISPLLLPSPVLRVHPPPCNPWGARYTGRMPRIWRRHVPAADWLVCSGHMSLTSGENHRRLPNWLAFGDPAAKILPLKRRLGRERGKGEKSCDTWQV